MRVLAGVHYYLVDNQLSIWHATHRDVHPAGATMAVNADNPAALVLATEDGG